MCSEELSSVTKEVGWGWGGQALGAYERGCRSSCIHVPVMVAQAEEMEEMRLHLLNCSRWRICSKHMSLARKKSGNLTLE